jgi:hypothetical protein
VSMIVAKQWAKEANDFSEWMALLVRNTGPQEQLTGSKDLTRAIGHRATVRPDDRKRPVYARPTVHSDGNTGLDDNMLISVALLNTGAVILFDFPKRLTNVCGHYSHLLNCLLKLLRGHSKLFCPISEFVIFVDIYPVAVPVVALRCVVGHSAICSPFGMVTDSSRLDSYVATKVQGLT